MQPPQTLHVLQDLCEGIRSGITSKAYARGAAAVIQGLDFLWEHVTEQAL